MGTDKPITRADALTEHKNERKPQQTTARTLCPNAVRSNCATANPAIGIGATRNGSAGKKKNE